MCSLESYLYFTYFKDILFEICFVFVHCKIVGWNRYIGQRIMEKQPRATVPMNMPFYNYPTKVTVFKRQFKVKENISTFISAAF